jgi:transposase-like protein
VTSINSKLGLRPAGKRTRLNALSGVQCPACRGYDVRPFTVHAVRRWLCAKCSHAWTPTTGEVDAYNDRVRERDRI